MFAIGRLVAFSLALPSALWSQATLAHIQLSVDAKNSEWTATTLNVEPGDMVLVQAAGKVTVGPYLNEVGPDGGPANMNFVGALDIKVGIGVGRRVGVQGCFFADQAGQVRLRVRDQVRYDDNAGSFTVNLIHVPAAAIPKARVVESTPAGR